MESYTSKLGLIGIGNCGNQITSLASKKYPEIFDCIYINTSDSDLNQVTGSGYKLKIGLDEVEGTGKNRNRAKAYLKSDIKRFMKDDKFTSIFNNEYVFIITSTAGGTGSGSSPVFLKSLESQFPEVKFVLVAVLPQLQASRGEQENTLEFLNEFYRNLAENSTYMIYDNETTSNLSSIKSLSAVNEEIVEDLKIISGCDCYPSQYDTIDRGDMETIVSTSGRLLVNRITKTISRKSLEDVSMDDLIIKSIKNSKAAETNRDKKIVHMGVISNLTNECYDLYDSSLPKLSEFMGIPINKRYNHHSVNEVDELANFVYVIMSGLSPITDRIDKIKNRLDELDELSDDNDDCLDDVIEMTTRQTKNIHRRGDKRKSGINDTSISIEDLFKNF